MLKKITLLLMVLTAPSVFAQADTAGSNIINIKPTALPVEMEADIAYSLTKNIMGRPLQLSMDLVKPYSDKPLPAVVFITGGGFIDAPKSKYIGQRVDIARAGYVVASINYRVVPTVTFPGIVEDAKTAVRFLRANADKFGIDPNKIAVMGESAGGYLAAMVATTNGVGEFDKGDYLNQRSDVQAAIDLYGLSDLTSVGADFSDERKEAHKSPAIPEAMLVNGIPWHGGGSILNDLDKAKKANPITYISKKTPPFLLMHGDADNVVSPSQTRILHEALVAHGINSTRYVVQGADHAGLLWYQPEIMKTIIAFLDRNLKSTR
ncbi:alpha/beta hydrolase [Pectobacterium polaris]|uniref:alpha/beta hydrolase n=1 Tax=Pectobacterium polaris TaxID=2042057 RepID=UPI00158270B6|nr:alpha/beta hydrolase [Pectobacterium polaris]MCU1797009.1 alpha/beta hydrolase [Pectobacterium polaris]UAY90477.1 alpha/beta hydrolase [Pectobacterium polaris]